MLVLSARQEGDEIVVSWYEKNIFNEKRYKRDQPLTILDLLTFLSDIPDVLIKMKLS